jgi:hypothetical protein
MQRHKGMSFMKTGFLCWNPQLFIRLYVVLNLHVSVLYLCLILTKIRKFWQISTKFRKKSSVGSRALEYEKTLLRTNLKRLTVAFCNGLAKVPNKRTHAVVSFVREMPPLRQPRVMNDTFCCHCGSAFYTDIKRVHLLWPLIILPICHDDCFRLICVPPI